MKSGIYKILNNLNGNFYIGSAKNLHKRKREHFNRLYNNTHPNIILQRAYNRYLVNNFEFIILENCNENILIEREQYYIDNLNPKYNICRIANSRKGTHHSQETKDRMRILKLGKKQSKEHIEKVRLAKIGEKKTKEAIDKSRKNNPLVKLNEDIVKSIRIDWKTNSFKIRELASKYELNQSTVENVIYNNSWKHVII